MIDLQGECLIEISGEGCAGCEAVLPVAREVAEELGLRFLRIEAAECRRLIEKWSVEKLPATVLCRDGEAICKCYGYQPKEILLIYLEEFLNKL